MTDESEALDVSGNLTLDSDAEEFGGLPVGQRACITVWGNLEANENGSLSLAVDKAQSMPTDYSEGEVEEEDTGTEEPVVTPEEEVTTNPAALAINRQTVKPPGKPPKSVVSVMIGRPKA